MLNYVNSKGKWNRASSVMEQDCRRQHSSSAVPHKTELEPKVAKMEQFPRHGNILGNWSPNSHPVSWNGHCAHCAGSLHHGLREKGSVSKADSSWRGTKVGQMICFLEESQLLHHFWRDASHSFKPAKMRCLMSKWVKWVPKITSPTCRGQESHGYLLIWPLKTICNEFSSCGSLGFLFPVNRKNLKRTLLPC